MRALVTGACGFVGRYLASELVSAGYEVLAADIADSPAAAGRPAASLPPAFPADVVYRRCDLLEDGAVCELVGWWRPDVVFHLAARSSAAESFDNPQRTLETNLFGTLHVLEALREIGEAPAAGGKPVRLLSIGSSEEYGRRPAREMPLREECPLEPVSPYAVSKAAQSMLALQYGRAYGLEVVVTRSFGHSGPGQSDRFVLPSFARQCAEIRARRGAARIQVGNLEVTRDFLDVRDVVRAYRLLAERGESGSVYNVCSGRGLELERALRLMIEQVPVRIEVIVDPKRLRPADVPVMVGSNEKLRRDTGWRQEITSDRMLADLIEYWDGIVAASAG